MCELSPVAFHGDTIFCIDYQNQPFAPMRPIVENIGLDWSAQAAKFRANRERWTVVMITTVAQDGIEREMLCMPVRKLPAWLASINPKKVKPELRERIELYQAECDDALWAYWTEGRAERLATPATLTPSLRAELKALVDSKLSTHPAAVQGKARSEIWSRFNRHFKIAEYAQLPPNLMPEAREYLIEMEVKALKALPTPAGTIAQGELVPTLPDDEFFPERAAQSVRAARLALQEAFEELSGLSRAYQRKYLHQPGKAGICFQSCSAFNEQWQCAISALSAALFTVRAMRSVDEI